MACALLHNVLQRSAAQHPMLSVTPHSDYPGWGFFNADAFMQ
jgi:hypothetical protein